jgi:prepilin-type N-terminal cleavage/methylation domain-containing protein
MTSQPTGIKSQPTIVNKANGFSLVELSIVLVILGLLTGGILTGQSLIRAAELRAITTEFQQYQTAVNTFRQKYFALPGDMSNATQFWGSASGGSCSHGTSATGTGTQTCNGDGNNLIHYSPSNNQYSEVYMFWQHLVNAGLINATLNGKSGSGSQFHSIPNQNIPPSKISSAGWQILDDYNHSGHSLYSNGLWNKTFIIGSEESPWGANGAILTADETWNIDTKIDDGKPFNGKIWNLRWSTCTTSTSASDLTGSYRLNSTSKSCALSFKDAI